MASAGYGSIPEAEGSKDYKRVSQAEMAKMDMIEKGGERSCEEWIEGMSTQKRQSALLLVLSTYLLIGYIYYNMLSSLHWNAAEYLYFVAISITTVGYGDDVVEDDVDKLFTVFFVFFGIAIVFTAFADIVGAQWEQLEQRQEEAIKQLARSTGDSSQGPAITHSVPVDDRDLDTLVRNKILRCIAWLVLVIVLGAIGICFLEPELSFASGIYWSFQTTTTVGYGDIPFTDRWSYGFAGVFALFSVVIVAALMGSLATASKEAAHERKARALMRRRVDLTMISALDTDGDGKLDRAVTPRPMLLLRLEPCGLTYWSSLSTPQEYVVGMLQALGVITEVTCVCRLTRNG